MQRHARGNGWLGSKCWYRRTIAGVHGGDLMV
jgi:hypothetical protein